MQSMRWNGGFKTLTVFLNFRWYIVYAGKAFNIKNLEKKNLHSVKNKDAVNWMKKLGHRHNKRR